MVKALRVGIDAYALGGQGGGTTYLRNILPALARVDPDTEYTLFLTPRQAGMTFPGTESMRQVVVPPNNLPLRITACLPFAAARGQMDLLHAEHLAPIVSPVPLVVNIHDISWEHHPESFTRLNLLKERLSMPLIARNAAWLLAVSEFTKQDIVRRYRIPPDRIAVAPNAVDPIYRPIDDPRTLAEVRARYGTGDRFILCVGDLQPRKNLTTLIHAYVRLRQAGTITHKLVLVGRKGWLYDDIFAVARRSGYEEDLIFTDYVPDNDLVALYNAADLFVYPSLFEGFGLPPLEAMACGTPVVTSNTSSLPEVVGDAGLMVAPTDGEALAATIAEVLTTPSLHQDLRARGLQRARTFSWERSARTVAAVYRQAHALKGKEMRQAR